MNPPDRRETHRIVMNSMVKERVAEGAPMVPRGMGSVPRGPGRGIKVDEALLRKPVYTIT